ncbi:hypothetical protein QBD00_003202 [Ochrobactrum sp. AN78]|nr:hypothetical protein [Ochrobactrum sp. AN78]
MPSNSIALLLLNDGQGYVGSRSTVIFQYTTRTVG